MNETQENIILRPIGKVVHSRKEMTDDYWGDAKAIIELDSRQFNEESLQNLDQFSHIEILFQFHLVEDSNILTGSSYPRGNEKWPKTGIFAQRKKDRPNRMGISICCLEKVEGMRIHVLGLDALEGSPVFDIKPVIKEFILDKDLIKQPKWASELMCAYFNK
jgi:tRNA-Thr(GGU) m(6)t(6)A37 methyltransferase TsaA